MKNITLGKSLLITFLVALFILFIFLASPPGRAEVISVRINPGTLRVRQKSNPELIVAVKDGRAKLSNDALSLVVSDSRGTGRGWSLIVSAGELKQLRGPDHKISADNLAIADKPDVKTLAGNKPPKTFRGKLGKSGLKLLSAAAGNGMGSYKVNAKIRLPASLNLPDGTYETTITETVIGTP